MKSTAIIRSEFKTGKYRVFDSTFADDGRRFSTRLEALKHAKSRGYAYVDMPGSAFDQCIDKVISRYEHAE